MKVLISRHEWRRVIIYTLAIIAVTSIPYLMGWANQGQDWRFSGFVFGIDDGFSYLGKMRLGARGILDFYLFYTPEAHSGAPLILLPYLLPGRLVGLFTPEQSPALTSVLTLVFHLMRVVFDILLIAVLYRFIARFLHSPRTRFLALVLATLGGGLGWLLTLMGQGNWLGSAPADFFIPEGFSFLILFGIPHLALARAALLAGLLIVINGKAHEKNVRPTSGILAGICWLLVGLAVPFYLAIIYCILGTWGLAAWIGQRRFPRRLALIGAIGAGMTLPLFIYYAVIFSRNPAFAQWSAQNRLPSPHPLHYIAAYVLLVIPAVIGARWAWRKVHDQEFRRVNSLPYALLIGWPLVAPLLVYLPINVQRRMAEAVIVPLAILTAVGLRFLARQPRWKIIQRPVLIGTMLTSLMLFLAFLAPTVVPARPVFQPQAEIQAFDWLNQNAETDAVVLAAFDSGNVLPAYTHLRPFVGHGPETMFATEKTALAERFFSGQMTREERAALYVEFHIQFIFYGEIERDMAGKGETIPAWAGDGSLIYDEAGYQIYRLTENG